MFNPLTVILGGLGLALFGDILSDLIFDKTTERTKEEERTILYHYTDAEGYGKILTSMQINASNREKGDAVHGEDVYLTNVPPGSGTKEGLTYSLWFSTQPKYLKRTEYFIAIDVTGLEIVPMAYGYILRRPGLHPLSLHGRLTAHGPNRLPTLEELNNSEGGPLQ